MASPDVPDFTDLTVYDLTPSEIADRAVAYVQSRLPGATVTVGSFEQILIEAIALQASELGYAINRIPPALFALLLTKGFRVDRSAGVAPRATVQFAFSAAGGEVPDGTLFSLDSPSGPVQFSTDADLTVLAGTPTGSVTVTGVGPTAAVNGVGAGTALTVLSATTGVTAATLVTDVAGGADPEDLDAYLHRGAARLARLTSALGLPDHFAAAAAEDPAVYRVRVLDNFDGTEPSAGHVTVAVLGTGGAPLSAQQRAALQDTLGAQAVGNLAVHVVSPTVTSVTVSVTVKAVVGADPAAVESAIAEQMGLYLSPDTWDWSGVVRTNEIIAMVDRAAGVDYVVSVQAPATDLTLPGTVTLARLGVLTVTFA